MTREEAIEQLNNVRDLISEEAIDMAIGALEQTRWIPVSERLPEECDEYMFTWVTSYAPDKRFIGFAEYDGAGEWDDTNGRWLFEDYIKSYPDVKVLAWLPLPGPYREDGEA